MRNKKGQFVKGHTKPKEWLESISNGITYCKEYHLSGGLHKNINKQKEVISCTA